MSVRTGNHSLYSTLNEDEAILIDITYVTGVHPNLSVIMKTHYVGGLLGVIHIAHHDGGTRHQNGISHSH